MSADKGQKIIIFVDIPDPDNLFMIIYLLRHYQKNRHDGKIAIVLSPRAVDFSIPRYGALFPTFIKAFKGNLMSLIMPITNEADRERRLQTAPESFKPWVHIDRSCDNGDVREDTILYMEVSILRFIHTLDRQGFSRDEYEMYWDKTSLEDRLAAGTKQLGDPAMRHAFHVHDFTYDFDDQEMADYHDLGRNRTGGPDAGLRTDLRALCERYCARMLQQLGKPKSGGKPYKDFAELIPNRENGTSLDAHLVIGGPFTEVSRYLEVLPQPHRIEATMMAGSRDRKQNIFPNQFNIYADVPAAAAVLSVFGGSNKTTKIVPTECIKKSEYQFTLTEAYDMLCKSEHLTNLVKRFDEDTGKSGIWCAFDVITAVAHEWKEAYTWEPVKGVYGELQTDTKDQARDNGSAEWYRPYEFKEDPDSKLAMAIPDQKYMASKRNVLMDKITSSIVEDV
jgi:inosine-uridine nucleoside N-ribohydrolase